MKTNKLTNVCMNQKLMQRYGDYWLVPNNWLLSSPVCCDNQPDLRQNAGKDPKTVAKGFIYLIKSEKNAGNCNFLPPNYV